MQNHSDWRRSVGAVEGTVHHCRRGGGFLCGFVLIVSYSVYGKATIIIL